MKQIKAVYCREGETTLYEFRQVQLTTGLSGSLSEPSEVLDLCPIVKVSPTVHVGIVYVSL